MSTNPDQRQVVQVDRPTVVQETEKGQGGGVVVVTIKDSTGVVCHTN